MFEPEYPIRTERLEPLHRTQHQLRVCVGVGLGGLGCAPVGDRLDDERHPELVLPEKQSFVQAAHRDPEMIYFNTHDGSLSL